MHTTNNSRSIRTGAPLGGREDKINHRRSYVSRTSEFAPMALPLQKHASFIIGAATNEGVLYKKFCIETRSITAWAKYKAKQERYRVRLWNCATLF